MPKSTGSHTVGCTAKPQTRFGCRCTMYNVRYTLYTVQCTVYIGETRNYVYQAQWWTLVAISSFALDRIFFFPFPTLAYPWTEPILPFRYLGLYLYSDVFLCLFVCVFFNVYLYLCFNVFLYLCFNLYLYLCFNVYLYLCFNVYL